MHPWRERLARWFDAPARACPLSPNAITIIALLLNLGAAAAMAGGGRRPILFLIAVAVVTVGGLQFPDVLGTHRLNLGDGYALHGTQAVKQLGQSVSHGCVRLRNEDIAQLYAMAKVGDEVIIY